MVVSGGSFSVTSCDDIMPAYAQPWALVLKLSDHIEIHGLPLRHFVRGPRGHLVWRNDRVSDADLVAELNKLTAMD